MPPAEIWASPSTTTLAARLNGPVAMAIGSAAVIANRVDYRCKSNRADELIIMAPRVPINSRPLCKTSSAVWVTNGGYLCTRRRGELGGFHLCKWPPGSQPITNPLHSFLRLAFPHGYLRDSFLLATQQARLTLITPGDKHPLIVTGANSLQFPVSCSEVQ